MPSWFATQIKRNAFAQAERSLTLNGLQVFAPKLERRILRYGKRRAVRSLLFPGYVFVTGDTEASLWQATRATEGLARLVLSATRELAPVPAEFMDALLARCDGEGCITPGDGLAAGSKVTLVSGPFAGLITRIEQIDEQKRIWILLELLGSARRVTLRPEHILPLAG